MQDGSSRRPYGITAISVLLLTVGANLAGIAIVNLGMDMRFLASEAGASARYLMFAYIFSGLMTAGFGIALYEGMKWARSASLFVLAFFTTLKAFSFYSAPNGGRVTSAAMCVVCLAGIAYLSLPEAKGFLVTFRKPEERSVPVGALPKAL